VRAAADGRVAAQGLAQQLIRAHALRVTAISHMALRLEQDPESVGGTAWTREAHAYIRDIPGLLALSIHDRRGFVAPPVTGPSGFAITPPPVVLDRACANWKPVTTPALVAVPFARRDEPAVLV